MITPKIKKITHYLPEKILANDALEQLYPEWTASKIRTKLGISCRHVVDYGETALDLAERACTRMFDSHAVEAADIDALIVCTQSPDFALPPDSCLLHKRLRLSSGIPVLDYAHGCSGFVYGLFLAKGIIESGQAHNVLLVNAETYSRYCSPADKHTRTVFGDAATATFIQGENTQAPFLDNFVFYTDGSGAGNLIVPASGQRRDSLPEEFTASPLRDGLRGLEHLYMNGREIFNFAMDTVPRLVSAVLSKGSLCADDLAAVILHQANSYMVRSLQSACALGEVHFPVFLEDVGNTVSCSIPLTLEESLRTGAIRPGQRVLLAGFGVGYTCAGCTLVI